jgi:hypothetical protein
VKKTKIKKVKKVVKKLQEVKLYKVEMIFNGETFLVKTNDLKEAIMSLKPEALQTELYITIQKGELEMTRKLTLVQGRKLFNDEMTLDIFITNLLF